MIRPLWLALALCACGPPDPGRDGGAPDAGQDAGLAVVTCSSNLKWELGNSGSEEMNPGYACRACHLGENFLGQNPGFDSNPQYAMFFMGTAYSDFNQANLCRANAVPPGTVIEILDSAGVLQLTLPVDPSGNFRSSSVEAQLSLPYRARVRSNGKVRAMAAAQLSGDCNSCHTEQGREGAPGRIVWP